MRHGLITLAFAINLTSCAHEVQMVKIHPDCPEIPATTFKAAGLDAKAGSLKFGELLTIGEISLQSDPIIISGISQSVRDDQTTDALICASKMRGELKTEDQVDHAWKKARFHREKRTADEVIRFYKENPFPKTPRIDSEMGSKEMQALRDSITGGDSFCFLSFVFASDAPTKPYLAIYLAGKFPLQNIHISILDKDRLDTEFPNMPIGEEYARVPTSAEMEKYKTLKTDIEIPALGPAGTSMALMRWDLPDKDKVTYQVNISTPFQQFHQHLKMRRINGEWIQAFRVFKTGARKEITVLKESVPDAFPKDRSGKVNWLYY